MDGDKRKEKSEDGDPLPNDWNVHKSNGIRCAFQNGFGFNKIILDYNRYFLPSCGFIFWTIFLLFKS